MASPRSQPKAGSRTVKLRSLHPGQKKVTEGAKRFNTLACGRRFGKTTLCEDRVVHPLLKGKRAGWFAPNYKVLDPSWEHMKAVLLPVTESKDEQQRQLRLIGGGVAEFWSLEDEDAGRGRYYHVAVVDEAAMVTGLMSIWDKNLKWQLLDYGGSAWFLSTPRGINNDFKTLFDRGGNAEYPEWASWQMSTYENPHIPHAEIEKLKLETPELAFAQEVLAQFVSWEGGVFRRIMDAVGRKLALKGEVLVTIDWAGVGQRGDFTVFLAIDLGGTVLEIKRFRGKSYAEQREDLKAFIRKWNPVRVVGEENNMGGPQIEKLREDGVKIESWTTSYHSKQLTVEALALMFEREQIAIAPVENHMIMVGELQSFEPKRTPTGLTTYAAASGHDDTVMALVIGAQYLAQQYLGSLGWIEWLKQAQNEIASGSMVMNKQGIVVPSMVKPAASDVTVGCPKCGSFCLQNLGPVIGMRCGTCGVQFGAADVAAKIGTRAEQISRLF